MKIKLKNQWAYSISTIGRFDYILIDCHYNKINEVFIVKLGLFGIVLSISFNGFK